ncbi:hypothetical protein GF357_05135, partial [Candidatus Dojkabacteria bacterium]|nr:hypothetical protein [Candidatus Dojkabacteria bacterium]
MAEALNKQRLHFEILDNAKIYEKQFDWQVGDDDYHLSLYPEIDPPARSTAPETLTDSNCIFVSNSSGDDSTGDGSEATPYATVSKAVTEFFLQASRVLKYVCLKDSYIYVEDVQIPEWLDGYIYADSTDDPRIRRVERTIPSGCNDSNTKWVNVTSSSPVGNDSTGDGSRSAPYLTIQKALDDIVDEAEASPSDTSFIYVAVRVD